MKNAGKITHRVMVLWLGIVLVTLLPGVGGAIPQKINYQGYLTNAAGVPINGNVQMVFAIYDALSNGTKLWEETHNVNVTNGVYNVFLGEGTPPNPINLLFDIPYYLSVKVGADPEMIPRQPLTTVGYAFQADLLDGQHASAFASSTHNHDLLPYVGSTASASVAFRVTNTGVGEAGAFAINNPANTQTVLSAWTVGTGNAGTFEIDNASNSQAALYAGTTGTGSAGHFRKDNASTTNPALWAETNGPGAAIHGYTASTTGFAGHFKIDNPSNALSTLLAETNGTGAAVLGRTTGAGVAIQGYTSGTGNAGFFEIDNTSNDQPALYAVTNGTGQAGYFEGGVTVTRTVAASSFTGSGAGLTSVSADTLDGQHAGAFASVSHSHTGGDITSGVVSQGVIDPLIARDSEVTVAVDAHASRTDNPHSTTAGQVGAALVIHSHNGGDITSGTVADARIDPSITRDSEVMTIVKANDGAGSGLDADLLDGQHASDFSTTSHNHDAVYVNVTGGDFMTGSFPLSEAALKVTNVGQGDGISISTWGDNASYSLRAEAHGVAGGAVYGYAYGSSGTGVLAIAPGDQGKGVFGQSAGTNGYAGYFYNYGGSGTNRGVAVAGFSGFGDSFDTHPGGSYYNAGGEFAGVNGVIAATSIDGTTGDAVHGLARSGDSTWAIRGTKPDGGNYAGYFYGNVHVNGTLSANTKAFKIDHPLDPANKYLMHYAIESPTVQNMYNGTIVLDAYGEAVVQLPDYFETVNTEEFTYTLTPIGASMPGLYVAEEVQNNQFKISGGVGGKKVSWMLMGQRNDPWVKNNPAKDVVDKPKEEAGTYLYPKGHGQPESLSMTSIRTQKQTKP